MNVLDMLQAYLAQNVGVFDQQGGNAAPRQSGPLNELLQMEMGRGPSTPDPVLPPYLPDAVRRSILEQSSYGEGEKMPTRNPGTGENIATMFGPKRDAELWTALQNLYDQQGSARQEARPWSGSAPSYPGPLNSMMGRFPLALY